MPPATTFNFLTLDPAQTLRFPAARPDGSSQPEKSLKLINRHDGWVAFKVKTTAPKSYLVRPSSGVVKPGAETEVKIILQPPRDQAGQGGVSAHRFLVQAAAVDEGTENVTKEQWAEMQNKDKDKGIQEVRLNVEQEDSVSAEAGQPWSASAPPSTEAAPDSQKDLQNKYDELIMYTRQLEAKKANLKARTEVDSRAGGSGGELASDGFSAVQLLLVAMVCFILAYLTKYQM